MKTSTWAETLRRMLLILPLAAVLAFIPLAVADAFYVASGQDRSSFWAPSTAGDVALLTTSYIIFASGIWWATRGHGRGFRFATALFGGAVAFAAWLFPAALVLYWFHLSIGGVE